MPGLDTRLHTIMLRASSKTNTLPRRLYRAVKGQLSSNWVYGLEWGDPETVEPLNFVKSRYVLPYVRPDHTAVEIGPGGGRWTRYMLPFQLLYVVDYYPELLNELRRKVNRPNMVFVENGGTDFPAIPEASIDFIFSFGAFVHMDAPLIEAYLANMKPILKPSANVVIQYSDKTKVMAQENVGFSENTPARMRAMVSKAGYRILEEDLTTMWHSSIIRFAP